MLKKFLSVSDHFGTLYMKGYICENFGMIIPTWNVTLNNNKH